MKRDMDGQFSLGLMSLRLQMAALFESSGGDRAVYLLDKISCLNKLEQEIILEKFEVVVGKVLSGDLRISSKQDDEMKKFEEDLFSGILTDLKRSPVRSKWSPKLMNGGKLEEDLNNSTPTRKLRSL